MRWPTISGVDDWDQALLTARAMIGASSIGRREAGSHSIERAAALLLHGAAPGAQHRHRSNWRLSGDLADAGFLLADGDALAGKILCGVIQTQRAQLDPPDRGEGAGGVKPPELGPPPRPKLRP